jgi:hypothetical protein
MVTSEAKGLLLPLADPEDMPVGVANVHLAHAPGHVGGWQRHIEILLQAVPVDGIDVVHPDRHPHSLVGCRVTVGTEGRLYPAIPATTLRTLAKEDLELAGANGPEARRFAPLEALRPAGFSNQATLSEKFEMFRIGATALAIMDGSRWI